MFNNSSLADFRCASNHTLMIGSNARNTEKYRRESFAHSIFVGNIPKAARLQFFFDECLQIYSCTNRKQNAAELLQFYKSAWIFSCCSSLESRRVKKFPSFQREPIFSLPVKNLGKFRYSMVLSPFRRHIFVMLNKKRKNDGTREVVIIAKKTTSWKNKSNIYIGEENESCESLFGSYGDILQSNKYEVYEVMSQPSMVPPDFFT